MKRALCIYCSSSDAVAPAYLSAAAELGRELVACGWRLVYGGANVGCMGVLAEAVHGAGGHITGVIPEYLAGKGLDYRAADELIVTATMSERKMLMVERAQAFMALPGGFGTLEELLEVITLKQLRYHDKAIVIVNTGGFYAGLLDLFEKLIEERFAKADYRQLYHVAASPGEALAYLDGYRPAVLVDKWF